MIVGSVSVDPLGVASGTGSSRDLYDVMITMMGGEIPGGPDGVPLKENFATLATMFATWIIPYIQTNAQLEVQSADHSLQKSNSIGNPTTSPGVAVTFGKVL